MVSGVLTLKASVAAAILAGTALASAGAGYIVSRATVTAQGAVTCPGPVMAAAPAAGPHALPDGGAPLPLNGKKW